MKKEKFYDIVLPFGGRSFYTYSYHDELNYGQIVLVPFRKKNEIGVVIKENKSPKCEKSKIKNITEKTKYIFSQSFLDFLIYASNYTMTNFGNVIRASLPSKKWFDDIDTKELFALQKFDGKLTAKRLKIQKCFLSEKEKLSIEQIANRTGESRSLIKKFIQLNGLKCVEKTDKDLEENGFVFSDFSFLLPAQKIAIEEIKNSLEKKPVVLNGITGSGKTEVYFALAKEVLEKEKQVLILLPEISLTVQFLERFKNRFGRKPSVWHSKITPAEKRKIWKNVYCENEKIVIGTRSALFLPYKNLDLIVVDEEHDGSYKQEDLFLYQARDMAVLRSKIEKTKIILASATPSFESLANVIEEKYAEVKLTERVKKAVLPEIKLIDLKSEKPEKISNKKGWISPKLVVALQNVFTNNRQAFLFLNRRGYAPLMICSKCGHRIKCPNCDVYMVYHQGKTKDWLKCHHCDYSELPAEKCPQCEETGSFSLCGPGIERLEEEAKDRFPNQKILVISSENTSTPKQLEFALKKIENNEVDLIIGTQILAKGHHFPALSVVGIIDADMSLMGADFRAGEKTLQLLEQTSGRAGREGKQGIVFIQTFLPDHPVMLALKNNDKTAFIKQELSARKLLKMPPYGLLISLILSGKDERFLRGFCEDLKRHAKEEKDIKVFGPADATIRFLRGNFRKRFLIQCPKNMNGHKFVKKWLQSIPIPSQVRIKIDVNPYNFM